MNGLEYVILVRARHDNEEKVEYSSFATIVSSESQINPKVSALS